MDKIQLTVGNVNDMLQVITNRDKIDSNIIAIDDNETAINAINKGTYYEVLNATGTPSENGTTLLDKYAEIKAKGLSLDADTRFTLYIPAGEYSLSEELTIDTEYIDVKSLSGEKDVYFTTNTINVTADNVEVVGINVGSQQFKGCDDLANIVIRNCEGGNVSFAYQGIANGTFINCKGGNVSFAYQGIANGTFINCKGGEYLFAYQGTANGTFINCESGTSSFGAYDTASGTFENCTSGQHSFGGTNGTASGTFINCEGSDYSFGGTNGTASGTFINCTGDVESFGGTNSTASGTFKNCNSGDWSFGGKGDSTASGTFINCTGDTKSFGGDGGTLTGEVIKCRLATGTYETPTGSGFIAQSIDGNNNIVNTIGELQNITTVNAATYDLLVSDYILNVTYTPTGAVTSLTLPTAQVTEGRTIIIKDAGGNATENNITIDTEGAETIDGAATLVISTDYGSVKLYSDGSNWFTI